MTTTRNTPTMTNDHDALVLAYYERERYQADNSNQPLAGLTMAQFRASRSRLLADGALTRTPDGRYVPTEVKA